MNQCNFLINITTGRYKFLYGHHVRYQRSYLYLTKGILLIYMQLQLQRNEVIALLNLLNRLSESVKFVNEMGPRAEKLIKRKVNSSPAKNLT
jgi:Endoplasmic Reticulum Oxidoreductin 1 (ERO1)